jgi:adenylate cyclase
MRLNPRVVTLGVIALLAPALSQWFVRELPALHRTELLIYDWHAGALPPIPPDDRIVLVGMDQESLGHLQLDRPSYPLPRSVHTQVVRQLHAAGAKVIAFDLLFTRSMPAEDAAFADAIKAARPVFCGIEPHAKIVDGNELIAFTPPTETLRPYLTPYSILAPPQLGKFRWFMPYAVDANSMDQYEHLSLALAEAEGGSAAQAPRGGDGEILIRFAGPANTFTPIPLYQVVDGSWLRSRGPNFFRDKAVLIGIIDPFVDRALTPVGDMQGVEVLAQAAQTVLQANWIRHWSEAENAVLKLALGLLLVYSILKFGFRGAFLVFALEATVWVFVAHRAFVRWQVWADTLEPIAALGLTFVAASAYEAGRVRKVFRRFMPSRVAEHMLGANPNEAPETREIEATIVFCDVRNSTGLAETLPSRQMEELLRRYFSAGEEAAERLGTELDKFVGDEIMLYFEDRRGLEHQALRAVRWAFEIQEACTEITRSGLAGDLGFRVGVGICTGVVRIGTVGAKQRIQHTVIGDAVNTASRLQTLTKELNQPIVIDETTWDRVSPWIEGQAIGDVPIRGKERPMKLYVPVRVKGE